MKERNIKDYTRVSEFLRPWQDFSSIDPYVLENKAKIGREVHELIQSEVDSIFLPPSENALGYFESWKNWAEEFQKDKIIVMTEKRLFCDKLRITGCVDAIVTENQVENTLQLIDYKTSARPNLPAWEIQGGLYYYLVKENFPNKKINPEILFIHLKKNGKSPKVHTIVYDKRIKKSCDAAITIYRHFKG